MTRLDDDVMMRTPRRMAQFVGDWGWPTEADLKLLASLKRRVSGRLEALWFADGSPVRAERGVESEKYA